MDYSITKMFWKMYRMVLNLKISIELYERKSLEMLEIVGLKGI